MILQCDENPYSGLELSTFIHNMSLPRHRWYEFKEGFSEKLVKNAVDNYLSGSKKKLRILDPFCGSGTTPVTAGKLGFSATAIEINPFLAFAANAKCAKQCINAGQLAKQLSCVIKKSKYEVRSPLEGYSTFTEGHDTKKWLFNRSVIRGFTAIDKTLSELGIFKGPLRLALFASLMECSNVKRDGKCLRYKENWQALGWSSADLLDRFKINSSLVVDDLIKTPFESNNIKIIKGDTRKYLKKFDSNSFDLLVTSPPYLNSFDYSDVYRPELFVGGFVKDNDELRKIRLNTVRSHVQVAWERSPVISSSMIPPIIEEISKKRLWNKRIPDMVQSYFADMQEIFQECSRVIRPRGQAWIVVSTSAYGGIEIPVDLILADVASRNGWKLRSVNILRHLRAAGQHWSHIGDQERLPLRESLIILERPSKRSKK